MAVVRKNSFAIQGGSFGDEGKGKVVDELCAELAKNGKGLVVYRWNGGANAGHTVVAGNQRIILHQIPSGVTTKNAICVLGKGMVVHPADLLTEINLVKKAFGGKIPGKIVIDEMAPLTLDTHRAYESVLKKWEKGGQASTGRGIAPAYADILLRHPVRVRDFVASDWKKTLSGHFDLYQALVKGLGANLEKEKVIQLDSKEKVVDSKRSFLASLSKQRLAINEFVADATRLISKLWQGSTPFIFEGAQGVGLDPRWGIYPDITASDTTFEGIKHSTQGVVDPDEIEIRAAVLKATYMSSVGKRVLPTKMDKDLAQRIREDAHEYGATTGRPRDIYHVDLPALNFFTKVSHPTHLILTHLDIAYEDIPIKVGVSYRDKRGKETDYRPDQEFLNQVSPIYQTFPSWNGKGLAGCQRLSDLPKEVVSYLFYLAYSLSLIPYLVTTGPKRSDVIKLF